MIIPQYQNGIGISQRLTFCVACCCIVYWNFGWFWICEIISG